MLRNGWRNLFNNMTIDELEKHLLKLYEKKDDQMMREFDRSLPFSELLFDRWERASKLGFSQGSSIYNNSFVFGDVSVGKESWIGPYTVLDGSGKITIGAYCSISSGVHIYTHDTVKWALSMGKIEKRLAPVKIGDGCYIGSQSIISPGVTIGDRSVVAANCFVNKDVLPNTIVAGTPARRIGVVVSDGEDIDLQFDSKSK